MKSLWSAKGLFNQIDSTARIVSLNGDCTLEVMVRNENSFWSRLKNIFRYLFMGKSIVVGSFFLSSDDIDALQEVEIDATREDS